MNEVEVPMNSTKIGGSNDFSMLFEISFLQFSVTSVGEANSNSCIFSGSILLTTSSQSSGRCSVINGFTGIISRFFLKTFRFFLLYFVTVLNEWTSDVEITLREFCIKGVL